MVIDVSNDLEASYQHDHQKPTAKLASWRKKKSANKTTKASQLLSDPMWGIHTSVNLFGIPTLQAKFKKSEWKDDMVCH